MKVCIFGTFNHFINLVPKICFGEVLRMGGCKGTFISTLSICDLCECQIQIHIFSLLVWGGQKLQKRDFRGLILN